jgi:hypothetical protein
MKLYIGKIPGRRGFIRASRTGSTTTKMSPVGCRGRWFNPTAPTIWINDLSLVVRECAQVSSKKSPPEANSRDARIALSDSAPFLQQIVKSHKSKRIRARD